MGIPLSAIPPGVRSSYMLDQLEGERIEIPGSGSVLRIITSAKETDGRIAVFYRAAVPIAAPVSCSHREAYNAFVTTKGSVRIWNGKECRDLYPGDFALVPPGTVYGCQPLAPYTELLALTTPGDQVNLYRALGEEYTGILAPTSANLSTPKVLPSFFDVHFEENWQPPELSPWPETDSYVPQCLEPYFLRANTGPQWMFGGILARPFATAAQCDGQFSISTLESSSIYPERPFFDRFMSFTRVDHCFCVMEGLFKVKLKGESDWTVVREGQTIVISARQFFTADIGSKFVRIISLSNGTGMDELICRAGYKCDSAILPETVQGWDGWDEARLKSACAEVGAQIE